MSNNQNKSEMIQHFIYAAGRSDGIYLIQTSYWESDAINAVGHLLKAEYERGHRLTSILNTNDTLNPLWCSPQEDLWIGSAWGRIWTSAPVPWEPFRFGEITFTPADSRFQWSVYKLPPAAGTKHSPNATAIWGTDNDSVVVGTFEGAIYHWDGREWIQKLHGNRQCIHKIHGAGPRDIFAVGEQGVIFHYDGDNWTQMPYPEEAGASDSLTGVRALTADEVLICGRSGRILHGNRNGFEVLGTFPAPFYGIGYFRGHIYLVAGEQGIWELTGNQAAQLKKNRMVGIFEAGKVLTFVEPIQPVPAFGEYNPDANPQWYKRTYAS